MMQKRKPLAIVLREIGVFRVWEGDDSPHFLLTSGLHSEEYFDRRPLERPENAALLQSMCEDLVGQYHELATSPPHIVIGVGGGGKLIAPIIAMILSRAVGEKVPHGYTKHEKSEDGRTIGLSVYGPIEAAMESVLLVDDVFTTGKSAGEATVAVRGFGLEPFSTILVLWNRNRDRQVMICCGRRRKDFRIGALIHHYIETFAPEECAKQSACMPMFNSRAISPRKEEREAEK